ncbi:putative reticulon-4-interacting protein 1-like, mitochondrial [Apostichopus japonicus]|uniref:Putative reticulon-4-interacting protein 1-like, mitochondrial n=1 Tax=Stichopus japonicus TaxID=307972 RepID=A0A2G8JYY8_STIJA|nr:putative reticulon-4-interacting protein 1-like, mitochondrial [Apostichopus japonicus]
MAVEGSKMCFVSAFMFVATAATLLTPDKGFEVTMGTVTKTHIKLAVAACAVIVSYRLLKSTNKQVEPAILFSDTKKMKAILVKSYGTHPMEIGTIARPRVTKATDVLIRVKAASLNPIDYRVKEGYGRNMLEHIRTKLGIKEQYGVSVSSPTTVDCYLYHEIQAGKQPRLDECHALHPAGTLAQYFLTSERDVSLKPKNMTHTQSASLPYVINTSYPALQKAGVNPSSAKGKRVLVLAGTGGIGSFVIQLLKAWECHVTTTCSADGFEMVRSLGADDVIDYKKESLVSAMEGKERFDYVFCTRGGNDTYRSCLAVCRSGGAVKLFYGKLFVHSFHEQSGARLGEIAELVQEGKIRACIDTTYDMLDANDALNRVKQGHARKDLKSM